jgi:hypothetical protein
MTEIEKYNEVITLGLDKRIARLKGGFVLGKFDPAVDSDRILRNRLNRFIKRKSVEGLAQMLQDLIRFFENHYDEQFASVLFQRMGLVIVPISSSHQSVSTSKQVRIGFSGEKENSLTFVSIELPTGSGSIYCIKGHHPHLVANWMNDHTIEIQIPIVREEIERVDLVNMYAERIHIIYKEIT